MLKIALCDDHPIFREGLKRILEEEPDMKVAEETGSGAELLRKAASSRLDVIILDLALPDMNGLDVLKALRTSGVRAGVLILSMHAEEHFARRVFKAGASGYLPKENPPEELVSAIRTIARGGKYVTATLGERLASEIGNESEKAPHEALSDREYQVLCMLAAGKRTKEIAHELGLSLPTVSTYRARVLEKLGMESATDLVRYALEHGLVE